MKKIILYTVLMTVVSLTARTQNLEHFKVDTSKIGHYWIISPNFEPGPKSGVNKFVGD